MQIAGREDVAIAADPITLWVMISDVTRTREWSPDVVVSRWIKPWSGAEPGARFETINRMPLVGRWRSHATVIASDPGRRFAFGVGNNPSNPNATWSWDLQPEGDATRVVLTYEMCHEPWIVLLYYRLTKRARHVQASVRTTLQRLKVAVEGQHATLG